MVISPYSAVNAIVFLSQVTTGKTLYQLEKRLNFSGTESDFLNNYVAYHKSLTESARGSTLIVANRLFVPNWYRVNDKFKEVATQKLSSGVEMIDFRNPSEVANTINNLFADKTQNRMGDIINPETLNVSTTQIVLLNNIFMKLNFEKVFE